MFLIQPILDKVIVKQVKYDDLYPNKSIIVTDDNVCELIYQVIAVGPGGMINDNQIDMVVKEGQFVIIPPHIGSGVVIDGQTYYIVKQRDILAIVER